MLRNSILPVVLALQMQVGQQQTTLDPCSPDLPNRALGCPPLEEVIECTYSGKHCYLYDALEPFCVEPFLFFESPFGGRRAEGPPVCTTTTTATYTVTLTTTQTVTGFTTTRPPAVECRDFCYDNSHPWLVKCGWSACASCGECASIILPSTSAESTSRMLVVTARPDRRNTTLPPTTQRPSSTGAGSAGGGGPVFEDDGSLEDAANSDQTTDAASTSTARQLESKTCLQLCYNAIEYLGWPTLCTWATCVTCPECSGTTVTATTTTEVLPPTFTLTTTFISGTTGISSTTSTMTRTASSTTSWTTTWTSTITSTTTDRACASPSPVLSSIARNKEFCANLSAGDFCVAQIQDHPCLYDGDLYLECPRNNILYREPRLLRGEYQTKCRICGFADNEWQDTDPQAGQMSVSFQFGANAILGEINETEIYGYGIFLADNCSRPVKSDPVGYIEKMDPYPFDERCCTVNAYQVSVAFELPPNFYSAVLMVRVNTSLGFLPVGAATPEIFDMNESMIGTADAIRYSLSLSRALCLLVLLSQIMTAYA
mmetsp:Transcript_34549/g.80622  ORF Transcript_34549/g.80622 Transcript_34549/m.80622 type:complete len:543 (+) Transcript_34549:59-1687(+)|eukprot:s561_g12.t1